MKKITLILLLVTIITSCKRVVVSTVDDGDNQVRIAATKSEEQGATMDVFATGDNIGIYTINKSKVSLFTDFIAANYGYQYAEPYWLPLDYGNVLKWELGEPAIFFYAYHPFMSVNGPVTNVTPGANDVAIGFTLPSDQTDINIRQNDLMRAENKGDSGNGLSRDIVAGGSVNLKFAHKLSKIAFKIQPTKDADVVIPTNTINLTNIIIRGTQIVNTATLSLKTGTLTTQAPTLPIELKWTGSIPLTIAGTTPEPEIVATMLAIPFEIQSDKNQIIFVFEYHDGTQTITKSLTYSIPVPVNPATDIAFKENQYNICKVKANLSNSSISITANIGDWDMKDFVISPM